MAVGTIPSGWPDKVEVTYGEGMLCNPVQMDGCTTIHAMTIPLGSSAQIATARQSAPILPGAEPGAVWKQIVDNEPCPALYQV